MIQVKSFVLGRASIMNGFCFERDIWSPSRGGGGFAGVCSAIIKPRDVEDIYSIIIFHYFLLSRSIDWSV